jgi:murein DD-endopeptidase MepM/ murein hydrolase activator NlpD
MTPRFYPAIKPKRLNQGWGTWNPDVYGQFGFKRHNGRDWQLAPSKKIFAPYDYVVARRGYQPDGGGNFVGIISVDAFDFPDFTCATPEGVAIPFKAGKFKVLSDFLHCEKILVNEGEIGHAGDLLAIGDNTGFSTGPHCHQQDRRILWDGKVISTVDVNEANNSFDPSQFEATIYAEDIAGSVIALRQQIAYLTMKLAALIKGK